MHGGGALHLWGGAVHHPSNWAVLPNDKPEPAGPVVPGFIIGGAPKCGTTSLHQVLHQHPDLWVAKNEVYFFDADDPIAHGDFLKVQDGALHWRNPADPDARAWYADRLSDAPDGALIGEDSTAYLMSEVAPHRIRELAPQAKVIFMLRDPVKRAYSQYWHLLRSGRTTLSFEDALSVERSIILGSTYAPALRRYYEALGPDRVHVLLFEEFKADLMASVRAVTDFLGVPPLPDPPSQTWHNKTKYPKRLDSLRRANWVGGPLVRYRYARHFGEVAPRHARLAHWAYRKWYAYVANHVLTEDRPPEAMSERTQDYLRQHLSARNAGLSDLLGKDLARLWPGFTQ